jgi:hypothetical protein
VYSNRTVTLVVYYCCDIYFSLQCLAPWGVLSEGESNLGKNGICYVSEVDVSSYENECNVYI